MGSKRRKNEPQVTWRGVLAWLGWQVGDLGRLLSRGRPPRGKRALGASLLAFLTSGHAVAGLAAALLLGAGLGYFLGFERTAPTRSHPQTAQAPHSGPSSPAPKPPALAETSPQAAPPAQPAPAQPAAPPAATHEQPHVAYEEPMTNGAAGGAENGLRKPILAGELAALAARPLAGPKPLWLQNARPMPEIGNHPIIALIIDDSGVDRRRTERAMQRLPAPVTMSFMTYAPEVAEQVAAAKALGHEIMMHMPMEPENRLVDPGPHALYVNLAPDEIQHRVDWDLSRFDGYVAVNNHMGSKFSQDPAGMAVVLRALKARGVFFLDSRTASGTVGPKIAQEIGLPHLERDVFLDNVDTRQEVSTRLAELERIARRDGYGIAIGHPRDATIDVLEQWTAKAQSDGFVLVPISTVMRLRLAAQQARAGAHSTQAGG